jgi:putative tryptophan/tyrosine transport system substrate-binding protein
MVVRQRNELDSAFAELNLDRPHALSVASGKSVGFVYRRRIVELAAMDKLPIACNVRERTEVGGLVSYGAIQINLFRRPR